MSIWMEIGTMESLLILLGMLRIFRPVLAEINGLVQERIYIIIISYFREILVLKKSYSYTYIHIIL